MSTLKQDIARMQELAGEAFSATGSLSVLADGASPEKLQKALEEASGTFERSALELRWLCEKHTPGVGGYSKRPVLPRMETTGFVERFGCGWLHIQLNTLLPHCRYQPSEWLSDTIRRLLDDYEASGREPPFFQRALLVIEEHCGVDGRHIFDQDNKGFKAVSNAIKGRLVPDDDQFTLALALLSEKSELNVCHITLLDITDAADFFATRSRDYAVPDFYDGGWE
ncbi:MAG: hypothetical protein HFF84_15540 [Oscillibacter sp.]|nr:hypothetical protein [Oscillibacter sp.]